MVKDNKQLWDLVVVFILVVAAAAAAAAAAAVAAEHSHVLSAASVECDCAICRRESSQQTQKFIFSIFSIVDKIIVMNFE